MDQVDTNRMDRDQALSIAPVLYDGIMEVEG